MSEKTSTQFSMDIGSRLSLELRGIELKLNSMIIGYVKGKFVLSSIPVVPEVNRNNLFQHIYNGNDVTVRYLQEGMVLGFKSEILHFTFAPIPLLFLTYPERVETYNLRNAPRITCFFPAQTHLAGQPRSSVISNISLTGCCIYLDGATAKLQNLDIDDTVRIECPTLFGNHGTVVDCKIKRIGKQRDKLELGTKFMNIPEDLKGQLQQFLDHAVNFFDIGI